MTAPTPLAWLHAEDFTGWARTGTCSMCRSGDVPVLWAGSVVAHGRARAVLACASCLTTLRDFVQGAGESPPRGPTRHGTGISTPAAGAKPRWTVTDRAFMTITVLGVTSLFASVAGAWWTVR
ncbi:hypothetical protein H7827_20635 [Streptomyces sp. JH002]|uniref:hypothetical protein n=1 Tax=Streptomyces sp. JH002 TaxID=2763259 RepID=UPI003D805E5F